jgi:N-acetylglutamate synthase/N-acetylornithine aminotransferase
MKKITGSITAPQGFLAQGVCADLKAKDKKDVALIYSQVTTVYCSPENICCFLPAGGRLPGNNG